MSTEQYQKDASVLRKAMAGWGTDEGPIIEIVANRTNAARQEILKEYKTMFGRDAIEDLESELGGNLGKVVQAMFKKPVDYDVTELHAAMKGAGTDEDTLIEIIGSRSTTQLKAIKEAFQIKYGTSLEDFVSGEVGGDIKKFLISLLQCNRSENTKIDEGKLNIDVTELYEAGEGTWGTDESVFNRIFVTRSPCELRYINKKYLEKTGKNLLDVVDSEFSGDLNKLYRTVIIVQLNPVAYYLTRIREACKGCGTDDSILIRVLVSRDEIDLKEINVQYTQNYGKSLKEEVEIECSGDYKNLLVALIKS